jgi:hypothetical protein
LARDDFILLRKSITLEQIFNYAFLSALIALLSGRILYVFLHPSLRYLNPLIFLIFIYFPGISVIGAVLGVLIFLFFISRKKKVPRGRIYDVFSLSFLCGLASNLLLTQLVSFIFTRKFSVVIIACSIVFFILFTIFTIIFQKGRTKDGMIGIVSFISFSLLLLVQNVLLLKNKKDAIFDKEIIILGVLLLIGLGFFVYQKVQRRRR